MTVTASIGVAAAPGASADLDDLLRAADGALYVGQGRRSQHRAAHARAHRRRVTLSAPVQAHRAGLAEQVALAVIASEVGEHISLFGTLDALTDHLGVQRLGERHDLRDDRPRALVIDEIRDERAVDLDLVEGELAQVGQLPEPGTEVVDGDSCPEIAQGRQDPPTYAPAAQQYALGDLEGQAPGRQRVLRQCLLDRGRQRIVGQLVDAHVYRYADVGQRPGA